MWDCNKYQLSPAQLEAYRVEGYVVLNSFFDRELLGEVDAAVKSLTARALSGEDMSKVLELEPEPVDGQRVPRRIYHPFQQHEAFRHIATEGRLLNCIETLIGPDFDLHHSKLNMKPARVGSVVEWHQDLAYFPHTNDDLVTTLVYLDDATEQNGCLQVLPRHQHHYFNHATADGQFAGMITEELSDGRFGLPVPLAAPAGSVILMHCLTPHSSLPNRSDRPRRTLIYEYRSADAMPIYFGEMAAVAERSAQPIQGKPARFARFGGPQPMIPRADNWASLYELQSRSKAQLQASK
jgi:ectoine hydroxylase-related dioxygenase (phytanoyl-CoA dioxygenase family)